MARLTPRARNALYAVERDWYCRRVSLASIEWFCENSYATIACTLEHPDALPDLQRVDRVVHLKTLSQADADRLTPTEDPEDALVVSDWGAQYDYPMWANLSKIYGWYSRPVEGPVEENLGFLIERVMCTATHPHARLDLMRGSWVDRGTMTIDEACALTPEDDE